MDEDLKLPDRLADALKALHRDATRRAQAVDPGRVATGVLHRLRAEPEVAVIRPRVWPARSIAAAIAVLVIGGAVAKLTVFGAEGVSLPIAVDQGQVAALDSAQQQALLRAVDEARTVTAETAPGAVVSVDDLSVAELETLLQTMENGDGGSL